MTPSATSIPTQTTEARAEAFMWLLRRGVLTPKQMKDAMDFGWAATRNRDADASGGSESGMQHPSARAEEEGATASVDPAGVSATEANRDADVGGGANQSSVSEGRFACQPAADVSAAKQEEKG